MGPPLFVAARLRLLRFWLCPTHRAGAATIPSLRFAFLPAHDAFDCLRAWLQTRGCSTREQARLIVCPMRSTGRVAALFEFLHGFCRTSWPLIWSSVPAFFV